LLSLGESLAVRVAIASIFGDNGTLANSIGVVIETISNTPYSQSQKYQVDESNIDQSLVFLEIMGP
jgi:hypothetical protein